MQKLQMMQDQFQRGMRESRSQPKIGILNDDLLYDSSKKDLGTKISQLQNIVSEPIINPDDKEAVDVKTLAVSISGWFCLTSKHFKPKSKKAKHTRHHHANQRRTTAVIKANNEESNLSESSLERDSHMVWRNDSIVSYDEKSVTALSMPKKAHSPSKFAPRKLRLRKALKPTEIESS